MNGYIEEMMEGQKVVKVFCHEDESIARFTELNDQLRDSANNANRIASMLMPVNGNLCNLSYVLCAVLGAILALNGHTILTVGTLVSFLALSKGFSQPVVRVSQQLNSIVMAAAGAERVFDIMDQPPEADQGYVELVNAVENPDGTLTFVPAPNVNGPVSFTYTVSDGQGGSTTAVVSGALAAVNVSGVLTGVSLGLNWCTFGVCAALGVPGVIGLLLLKVIFGI